MGARWSWHAICLAGHEVKNFSGGSNGFCSEYNRDCPHGFEYEYACEGNCPIERGEQGRVCECCGQALPNAT